MSMQFEHLFSPIKIRHKTARNRIAFPSHATRFPFFRDDATPEQYGRYLEYQRARARGGCGLNIIGTIVPHWSSARQGALVPPTPEILIPKLKQMAKAIHDEGGLVFVQTYDKGNTTSSMEAIKAQWGFTARPSPDTGGEVCHEMDDMDINEVIDAHVLYAKVAKEGGLDGIELHGAHGYLIQESWTNWTNLRKDKWGEPMAFATEMIKRVRAAVGNDFIVGMRIVSDDFHPNGMDNEAQQKVAAALEATGGLDYLNVSEGSQLSHYSLIAGTMYIPPATWMPLHSGIKKATKSIPIIAGSSINEPTLAEQALADGHCDMLYICRGQVADPEFANKAREGRVEDIRLCIRCNQGCFDRVFTRMDLHCLQSATTGHERELGTITPAPKKKKVMVIGGGPAGLEAARVAALRGHDVTVYEKAAQVGGQINTLTKVPSREEFSQVIRYLTTQLGKLKVNIKLNTEVTVEMVKKEKPDTVIVATGATPFRQPVPGVDQKNVFTVTEVLEGAPVGDRVLVYDASTFQEPTSCAEFLADQGKKVDIVTPYTMVGLQLGPTNQPLVLPRLREKGIGFTVLMALKKISGNTVTLVDVFTQEERTVEVDTVVLATGYRSNDSIWRALRGQVKDLHIIGDANAPRRALDALHEAYKTAYTI